MIALLTLAIATLAPIVPSDPVLEGAGAYVIPGYVTPIDSDPDEELPASVTPDDDELAPGDETPNEVPDHDTDEE